MDLSWAKFPIIILLVVGALWLFSAGGINFMHNKFAVEATEDEAQNKANEKGLTTLAGFLMKTFRYEKADEVLTDAITLYPKGKNALYNQYRLAKAKEKQAKYQETITLLSQLKGMDAYTYDDRIPDTQQLQLRIDKLAETHELGQVGQW